MLMFSRSSDGPALTRCILAADVVGLTFGNTALAGRVAQERDCTPDEWRSPPRLTKEKHRLTDQGKLELKVLNSELTEPFLLGVLPSQFKAIELDTKVAFLHAMLEHAHTAGVVKQIKGVLKAHDLQMKTTTAGDSSTSKSRVSPTRTEFLLECPDPIFLNASANGAEASVDKLGSARLTEYLKALQAECQVARATLSWWKRFKTSRLRRTKHVPNTFLSEVNFYERECALRSNEYSRAIMQLRRKGLLDSRLKHANMDQLPTEGPALSAARTHVGRKAASWGGSSPPEKSTSKSEAPERGSESKRVSTSAAESEALEKPEKMERLEKLAAANVISRFCRSYPQLKMYHAIDESSPFLKFIR